MTAEEIRKLRDDSVTGRVDDSLTEESLHAFFLAEVAAQLAELNAFLRESVIDADVRVNSK